MTRRNIRKVARRVLDVIDTGCDVLALSALVVMVAVVAWQVFARYVPHDSPRWSSEIALLLIAWLGLLGIAIGIRERAHIAVTIVAEQLPLALQKALSKAVDGLTFLFGLYLVVSGTEFTMLMNNSTLPSTGLPTSVEFAAMPVAGVLICVYSLADLFDLNRPRYRSHADRAVEESAQAAESTQAAESSQPAEVAPPAESPSAESQPADGPASDNTPTGEGKDDER